LGDAAAGDEGGGVGDAGGGVGLGEGEGVAADEGEGEGEDDGDADGNADGEALGLVEGEALAEAGALGVALQPPARKMYWVSLPLQPRVIPDGCEYQLFRFAGRPLTKRFITLLPTCSP